MSDTSTGECTAHNKRTKAECVCQAYDEDEDAPGSCICSHSRHFHLLSTPGASKKSAAVKSLLAGMILGSNGSKTKAGSSKGHTSSLGSIIAASSTKSKSPALSAAHREANEGMRPSGSGGGKRTGHLLNDKIYWD
ncbi:hypothetical protein R3P38DRAFT_2786795 [Favolaschia claudopus]